MSGIRLSPEFEMVLSRRQFFKLSASGIGAASLATLGCRVPARVSEPAGAASSGPLHPLPLSHAGLDVVTLNIKFARRIDRARQLFARVDELARAHIVLLQEMDAEGTETLASALRMSHVYHRATVHAKTGRDFGNAVLARWPIVRDQKLALPHLSLRDRSPRAATCVTVVTPSRTLEVCSLHLATPFELPPSARRDQVRAVLNHLRDTPRVVMGGDFNSYGVAKVAATDDFEWTTRNVGSTVAFFSVDHIFVRGLRATHVGRVTDTLGATDHAAVWARLMWC
jgi:endonuclease/exonuclease/phosphatase family metal-dependent hydrolase